MHQRLKFLAIARNDTRVDGVIIPIRLYFRNFAEIDGREPIKYSERVEPDAEQAPVAFGFF